MAHLQNLSIGYHIDHPSGKIRKIVEQNSAATETFIAHNLPDFTQAMCTPIILIVLLLVFDWRLGLACLVPIVVAMVAQIFMMGSQEKRALMVKKYQDAQEEINHAAVEYVRGISVVKVFNQTVYSFRNFHRAINDFKDYLLQWSLDFEPSYRIFMTAINDIFIILVPLFILLYNNSAQPQELLMNFMFYVILMPVISSSILRVMYMSSFQTQALESFSRINSILDVSPTPVVQQAKIPQTYDIEFCDVSFRYHDSTSWALQNASCQINNGQMTALVGQSGSGKTTMANLIMSFYQPTQGSITIGGIDLKAIGQGHVMDLVSYVFQENRLLKMSILDNIRVAKPTASKEEVIEAMQKAQCADIIDRLPDGLDTYFGQKGVYLSGGEIQRVAIARALLKDAPIVVLDEATAFTDPENEYKIKQAFEELIKNKTVIMIAHRLSSIVDADKIIVMSDGKLIESGKQKELLEQAGRYAEMWTEFNKGIKWTIAESLSADTEKEV